MMIQGLFLAALEVVAVYCPHAQSNPPLRPLVGILDSTSASDVSTEIALASNAGIGVFLYDATMDGLAEAEKAIDMGFLSAENSQGMKFAVCGRAVAASEESFVHFVERIGGRYFPHPEYWHRDGRPVLAVTDAADFVRTLGSDAARRAVKSAREKLRSAGVGEFELVARGVTCAQAADIQAVGFDVVQTETVPTDSGDPVRFEAALRESKSRVGASADGWVLLDAWNDYLHGRHLLPNLRLSDQMLRCVGRVFGRKPAGKFTYCTMKHWWDPNAKNGTAVTVDAPTHENVKYGPHMRQSMDVWLAKPADGKPAPVLVNIHGGGWVDGDRMGGVEHYLPKCRQRGITLVTISYRMIADAHDAGIKPPVKACLDDAVAAVRYVQDHAKEWNIDPTRIGLTGGSAGACSSLYASLQGDNALGVKAVFTASPQTSIDPKEMKEWIPNSNYGAHAFGYGGFNDWLAHRADCLAWIERFSPAGLLRKCTAARAPVFLYNCAAVPPNGQLPKDPTHAGMFCVKFKEICDAKGVTCRQGGLDQLLEALKR